MIGRAARIEELCQGALDLDAAARDAWLREACGTDDAAYEEVSKLLSLSASATDFLESPAVLVAQAQGAATLAPGDTFGHLAVTGTLGVGGMGEVYRAHDARLRRDVALKVLPDILALDPDRVRRFEREAQTLAAVSHPNIAAIFGIEESAGRRALVLELVEGPTLAERLAKGRLPIEETLAIARQLGDALEAAHSRGVVHRDLKPANIKVRLDGTIKVLDFGLARMFDDEPDQPGAVMGTAAYMSPEQARGEDIDERTDVWAFGCVLYEMLTGKPAFRGESREVDFAALPRATPEPIRRLLRRCLARERRARLRDMADARLDIDDAANGRGDAPAPRASWGRWVGPILALAGVVAVLAWPRTEPPAPPKVAQMRAELAIPPTFEPTSFEISPDGSQLAFVANDSGASRLWVRDLRNGQTRALAGTDGAASPFWSADNRSVGFFSNRRVMRIEVADGALRTLGRTRLGWGGAFTSAGGVLFTFTQRSPISRASSQGGAPTSATELAAKQSGHRFPVLLPDGEHFLFYAWSGGAGGAVFAQSLRGGKPVKVIDAESQAIYSRGYLLFAREFTLYAQAFDPATLAVSGEAIPIAKNVSYNIVSGRLGASVSIDGVLVYRESSTASQRQFVWFDRMGRELGRVGPAEEEQGPASPVMAPDGRRIAIARAGAANPDVWLMDVDDGKLTRLTLSDFADTAPAWSPDGTKVAFASDYPSGRYLSVYSTSFTAGAVYQLLSPPLDGRTIVPDDWSPDGKYLLCDVQATLDTNDIVALTTDGRKELVPVQSTSFEERAAQFSPDGGWIAYQSDESGRFEVYAQPFRAAGERVVISPSGGTQARWSRDGRELFYIAADLGLMSVPVTRAGGRMKFGTPVKLFQTQITPGLPGQGDSRSQYVVSKDSRRFLVRTQLRVEHAPLIVLTNWWP